ncbi:MAG TPA: hypothetical protein VNU45_17945 [Rummeliibacillus sp.]|nr:hypothetical protein [Rummeliibacillus sp.]
MINKRIAYTHPVTGNLCLVSPSPEWLASNGNDLHALAAKDVPSGVSYEIIDVSDYPRDENNEIDRYFRDAWKITSGKIDFDIDNACKIKMDKLRLQRNEILKELDITFMKAMESQDNVAIKSISDKKKLLRDMPQDVDLSKLNDIKLLRNYVPDCFKI